MIWRAFPQPTPRPAGCLKKTLVMRRAALLGIFALGLTGVFAIACAPSYGEADPSPAAGGTDSDTYKTNLPTDPSAKAKPPTKNTTSPTTSTTSDGGGSAPPKTPGSGGNDSQTDAGTVNLDGGACSKDPSPGGYIIHPPTAKATGACSTADIGYYEGLLAVKDQTFGGIQKALNDRNPACAKCAFAKYEDPTWSPIVMLSAEGGFYNWGSCYANSPGGSPACAAQVQQWFSCLDDACGDCLSDAEYNACIDQASNDNTKCGGMRFDACGTNLDQLNLACDSIAKAITVSCGP